MQNLSNFALAFQGIPSTPEEDYIGGKSTWRDGKLISYDWGTFTDVFLAHYDEVSPKYNEETGAAIPGEETVSTRAFVVQVSNPVTREKILDEARKQIYVINGMEEQLNFTQKILAGYVENSDSKLIKDYEEVNNWINWQINVWEGLTLENAKAKMIAEIEAYDSSDAVNSFFLNFGGTKLQWWIDKSMRVGLMNSTNIQKAAQEAQKIAVPMTTLWYNSIDLTLACDAVIGMLSQLEIYALDCFNVTAEHKAAIQLMDSIEDILNYDYKTGYPEKLTFDIG